MILYNLSFCQFKYVFNADEEFTDGFSVTQPPSRFYGTGGCFCRI